MSIRGVPVKIHWSFLIMLLGLFILAIAKNLGVYQATNFFLQLLILFICVLIHEFGHALIAIKLNVRTKDIFLSPIGGLARLEALEAYPRKEILIALGGPLANLMLAAISYALIEFDSSVILLDIEELKYGELSYQAFLHYILIINLLLCFLNLIPAFPMDGGRILRALLSLKMSSEKASFIAVSISRVLAITGMVYGAMNKFFILVLVSVIVWLMASREIAKLRMKSRDIKKAGPSFPPTNRPEEDLNT